MAYSLLGMIWDAREKYPQVPPEFGEHVGWLVFALLGLLLFWAWTRSESLRRSVLALEDPRTFAVLRIGFAICTIICFWNLEPYWRMLWSDEGIFDLAYAQDRLGRSALRGWSPDEGFFDVWAVLNFLWNKPSLFYFWGSPNFVVWHMLALFAVCVLYGFGVFSRVTGVVAWFLVSSVYNRNALYWEGTDTVYRCFWFILLFAKTGHAWSFDNWWRCRRLRKKGRLEEPTAEAEPPPADEDDETAQASSARAQRPKEPIYRRVPAWPRYLFMLQLSALYLSTGAVKTGVVWDKGDALYYALNMDHFYRFELATQYVSAVFGMNLFRVMTWTTHWWECLFPVVLVGVVLRFGHVHRGKSWYEAQNVWWRKWLGRAALIGAYALVYRITVLSVPFCLAMNGEVPTDPGPALQKVHAAFGVVIPVGIVAWVALRRWPLRLLKNGRSLGPLTRRVPWLRIPPIRIDHESLRRWLLGRRVWLTLGFMFHGFLVLFMNIGMFPFIMLMTYAAFVTGEEFARGSSWVVERMRRGRAKRFVPRGIDGAFVPAQRYDDCRVRGRRVPDVLVLVYGLLGLYMIYAKANEAQWPDEYGWWWVGLGAVGALAFRFLRPRPIDELYSRKEGPPLAYGSVGRALALFAVVWHSAAVGLHLFPSYSLFSKWRSPARAVFSSWLSGTGTSQSWRMFAPNPPRGNTFMKTVVVEADGDRWDLRNNAWEYRPNPWIINDRMRKMHRRMVGKGKWYLKYWAAFHCREWTLKTGEVPVRIEIRKIVTSIPMPEVVNVWQPAKLKGRKDLRTGAITGQPYDPRKLTPRESDVQQHKCRGDGELPLFMKERYGLPITDEDRERAEREAEARERKFANRRESWERRRDWGKWWDETEAEKTARQRAKDRAAALRHKREAEEARDDDEGEAPQD